MQQFENTTLHRLETSITLLHTTLAQNSDFQTEVLLVLTLLPGGAFKTPS